MAIYYMRMKILFQTELSFHQNFVQSFQQLQNKVYMRATKQASKQAIERATETVSLRKPGLKEGRRTHTYLSNIIIKSLRKVFLTK